MQGSFAGQPTLTNKLGHGGYRAVVATNRRFLVFRSGSFSQTTLKHLLGTAPRDQLLGEPSGLWHDVELAGVAMKVNRRYFKVLEALDRAASASA